jgi:hypothetical protein
MSTKRSRPEELGSVEDEGPGVVADGPGSASAIAFSSAGRDLFLGIGPALGCQVILQRGGCGVVDGAGGGQAVRLLQSFHGVDRLRSVDPVDLAVVVAGVAQGLL